MDRLIAEIEVKNEEKIETETQVEAEEKEIIAQPMTTENSETVESSNSYLNSFENMTVADFKKQEEERQLKEFQKEKEELIQKAFEEKKQAEPEKEEKQEVSQKIIEKPNYDLIGENPKIVKLTRTEKPKKKMSKKRLSLFLSLALGISAIICLTNVIIIDHMSSNLAGIEHEYYEVNLPKYLKDIADLDTTKKSMEFIETYPDEVFDAGQAGQKSNWFDKLCNFFSGLFGG